MEGTIDRPTLHRYVNRLLTLHAERKELNASIGEVFEEAKSAGFVTKIIRQIVRERQMDDEDRETHYALLDTYRHALGMLADTPLGQAAMATATVETAARPRPRPFAEQPLHRGRGRPKTPKADLIGDPAGAA